MQQLGLEGNFGLLLRKEFGRKGGIGLAHLIINISMEVQYILMFKIIFIVHYQAY